jgi:sporulation integral membrane protein YtvI
MTTHEYLPSRGWKRVLVLAAYILIGAAVIFIAMRWLLAPALPFIAAWAIAAAVQPVAKFIAKYTRIPQRVLCIVLVCGLLALVGLALTSLCSFAMNELGGMLSRATEEADVIFGDIENFITSISDKLNLPSSVVQGESYIHDLTVSFVKNTVTAVASRIPEMLGGVISALPGVLFFVIVTFIASLYLSADYKKLGASIIKLVPESARSFIGGATRRLGGALIKYIKAYSIIALITFSELSVGFLVLQTGYAFTLAALIALADALPLIGAGAALLPWAIIMLLRGDIYRGIGLLVIYATISIVRQFVEPRVVGGVSGLHPLAALAAMYCGLKLFGVIGLFAFPFATMVAGGILHDNYENKAEKTKE